MNGLTTRNKIIAVVLTLALAVSCFCIAPSVAAAQADDVASGATASHGGDTFSWDNATVYFLLTDRFNNGDPTNDHSYGRTLDANGNPLSGWDTAPGTFHGGDFAGITQKIEEGYFDDLGVNAIWMSAPYEQIHGYVDSGKDFVHYSYHGYYVLDYTEADANFGTKEEFQKLVDTAHEHGIRIVMDIVMNHAGYNTIADMEEYNYGTLLPGASDYKYRLTGSNEFHSYIDYESSATDWGRWWGSWIRSGLPGYTPVGGDELTNDLGSGLPDFKTESTATVNIPEFLKTKWTKEGTYSQKIAEYGNSGTVSDYLTTWLAEWVEEFGVDGFRCDTAKHVEKASWNKLKTKCVQALRTWKANNPDKALDDLDFWMTGEVWDHGVGKDAYYTEGGFDSLINFTTQGGGLLAAGSVAGIYSDYAASINSDPDFNVLSYLSSHDSVLASGDMVRLGSAFLLLPGAVQIYYGDESGRGLYPGLAFDGNGGAGHSLRSDMNWSTTNATTLAHWQKVGTFRNNHIAVGGGSNAALTSTAGTAFSRIYNKNNILDKVACVIDAGANKDVTIDVSTVWEDGQEVVNAYDDSSAVVTNGKVTFNSGANGTILIQEPDGKPLIKITGETNFTGTQTLTLTIDGADSAKVSVDGGNKFVVNNGGTFTIGENAYDGSYVKVTAQATNENGTSTKNVTFYKLNSDGSGPAEVSKDAIIHIKPYDSNTNLYVWYGASDTEPFGSWPGTNIMSSGTPDADGYYTFNLNTTESYSFIVNGNGAQSGDNGGNTGEIWVEATANDSAEIKPQEALPIDQLKTTATSCKVLTASEYTAASYSAVSSALSAAETVIAKGDSATAAEITTALSNLSTAKAGLKLAAPSITTMVAGGTVIAGKTATEADVVVTVSSLARTSATYNAKADDITGAYSVNVPALKATDVVTITATKNGVASEKTTTTVDQGGVIIIERTVGDVDGDGRVKLLDALLIARYNLGMETLTGISLAAADVNGDGNANLADAIIIQKYVAKMTVTSKIGEVITLITD